MEKSALRKQIRNLKRQMTKEQIDAASASLAEQFFATDYYRNARTSATVTRHRAPP